MRRGIIFFCTDSQGEFDLEGVTGLQSKGFLGALKGNPSLVDRQVVTS
jgi:hypothetical protein